LRKLSTQDSGTQIKPSYYPGRASFPIRSEIYMRQYLSQTYILYIKGKRVERRACINNIKLN